MAMKQKWSDVSEEPISEAGIRAVHVPEQSYRIDAETHPAGRAFTVRAADDFVLYVLSGVCKTTLDGMLVQLGAGEFLFLAKGAYQFRPTGSEAVQLMKATARS